MHRWHLLSRIVLLVLMLAPFHPCTASKAMGTGAAELSAQEADPGAT